MPNVFLICLFEQLHSLRIVTLDSHGQIGRAYDISPIPSDHAALFSAVLFPRNVGTQSPVGVHIGGVSIFEGEASLPPLTIVIVVDDRSIVCQEHVVIPINQVRPVVIPFFVQISQSYVSEALHIERHIYLPAGDYF